MHCNAQTTGSAVFKTLNSYSSARIAGLAGNQIAVQDGDLGLAFVNPALLDSTCDKRLELSYTNYFADVNFGAAHFAKHYSGIGTAALSIQYVDLGDFQEIDANGIEQGNFNAQDLIVNLGMGRRLDSNFTAGVNLKFINSVIAEYSSSGIAADFGLHYYSKKNLFSAAALIKNVGTQFSSYRTGNAEDLPFEMQIGFTKKLRHAPFRFGFIFDNLQQWDVRRESEKDIVFVDPLTGEVQEDDSFVAGDIFLRHLVFNTEVFLGKNVMFRFGYNYRKRKELALQNKSGTVGFSAGLSVKVKKFHLTYGRNTFHLAGPSNHLSINTSLSDW